MKPPRLAYYSIFSDDMSQFALVLESTTIIALQINLSSIMCDCRRVFPVTGFLNYNTGEFHKELSQEITMLNLPVEVIIREEGPRDGFQNEKVVIPTPEKIKLINMLTQTGIKRICITAFVHPKWVPQLSDAEQVLLNIIKMPQVIYSVLIPNIRGLERAINVKRMGAKLDAINFVFSASDTHNRNNVNKSTEESMAEVPQIIERSHRENIRCSITIATSFGCVFEGKVPQERVLGLADRVYHSLPDEIVFADTVGYGNPEQVYELLSRAKNKFPNAEISAHFHDTRGMGIANAFAALQAGINVLDSSIAGLGGCPFAPGAAGNISTEKLAFMLSEMGIRTGLDLSLLNRCAGEMVSTLKKLSQTP